MTLPSFLVIGAAKAGSTSLDRYLAAQPGIFMCPWREPRFFDYSPDRRPNTGPTDRERDARTVRTLDAYLALFDDARPSDIVGERSSLYLYSPRAPAQIKALVPDMRLIACLRDPSERAFSQFLMHRRFEGETVRDFRRALELEEERIAAGWSETYHYRRRGLYGEQLARYLSHFPREQMKIFLFEDFVLHPDRVLDEICRFVGLPAAVLPPTFTRHNQNILPRSMMLRKILDSPARLKRVTHVVPAHVRDRVVERLRTVNSHRPTLDPRIRSELIESYADDIRLTQELIGRDLSTWLRVDPVVV